MTNGNTRAVLIKESGMERTSTPEYMMENVDVGPHSPTDSSEDSVEVKVEAITGRSKRKLAEPRRINDATGPLKKRICIRSEEQSTPFRPWSVAGTPPTAPKLFVPPALPPRHSYFRPPSPPPQPVDLIKKEPKEPLRIPLHPSPSDSIPDQECTLSNSLSAFPKLQSRKEQRNYKNMTRERRIEANARERTRVHTISAAFDTLRRSVPAYSHSQKLSKLSVLRIACSYITTLSNMLEDSPETLQSVENVSRTIQREGKLRKKKDED